MIRVRKATLVFAIAASLAGSACAPSPSSCDGLDTPACEEAIATAIASLPEDSPRSVSVSLDRAWPSDCVRPLPNGGEAHIDPCPQEHFDVVARVSVMLARGRVVVITVVRETLTSRFRVAGLFL